MTLNLSALADLLDPPPSPSPFEALGYEPNCRLREEARKAARSLPPPCGRCPQEQFHAATEDRVVYGGAAGGGKTKALVMEAIRLAVAYPGMTILLLRETMPQFRLNIETEYERVGFCQSLGARYNLNDLTLRFPNGSKIVGGYLDDRKAAARYQGSEFQCVMVDELTLIAPGLVEIVLERLRSGNPRVPVIGLRATCNPGGLSHGEVKTRYIDTTDRGQGVVADEVGRLVRFIPAKVGDNPRVNEEYLRDLHGIPDPQRRAAMLDGSWDQYEGQVFTEWRYDRHVIEPFVVPEEWPRYAGIDFGYADPSVCEWVAVHDSRVYVYRELTQRKVGYSAQARAILAAEADDPCDKYGPLVTRYADPAGWAKTGEHNSYADDYAAEGCGLHKAKATGPGSRLIGWARLHDYLGDGPACDHHRAMGWEECPKLHVFASCRDLIRSIPSLTYDASVNRPEDVDTHHPDDHWADALRYCLVSLSSTETLDAFAHLW